MRSGFALDYQISFFFHFFFIFFRVRPSYFFMATTKENPRGKSGKPGALESHEVEKRKKRPPV